MPHKVKMHIYGSRDQYLGTNIPKISQGIYLKEGSPKDGISDKMIDKSVNLLDIYR